ncbi:LLM class flavin-dependent oxidoreductase [Microbacterium sp. No. 7]|uniref:LLM class flavin-dependent oxidoreductase n=1 Tax=Microbacterium sp. No. 7 TaxID=1714373 RepID=UPI0006D27782|nr:LLM class flavin-dependent oxidoreductase [Microbacterium sp. No. 7]
MSATPNPVPRTTAPLAASGAGQELRVGFITHLDQHDDLHRIYGENIRLIQALEEIGFDSAWIATRHFYSGFAALPSPFAFYGAAAQATSRIHLGTAVLPLVPDDPVRDAEEAAALDYLSGGRLQLGLGKGVPSDAYSVFAKWGGDRELEYDDKTDRLKWAVAGGEVEGTKTRIWPPNEDLLGRIYHGTSNWETIRRAARHGDGLILERFGTGDERHPDRREGFLRRQADSIVEYRRTFRDAWGGARTPYVVLSRSAWPGSLDDLARTTAKWNDFARELGRVPLDLDAAGEALADNVVWGDPEELAGRLLDDPSVLLSDELVLGIHPSHQTIDETIERARVLYERTVPIVRAAWAAHRPTLDATLDTWQIQQEWARA